MKKVVVLGPTGSGKSALCNILAGRPAFTVSAQINSQTSSTSVTQAPWLGNGEDTVIIDTPGHGDSEGRDSEHIRDMVEVLKSQLEVHVFIILFNGESPRFDEPLKSMINTLVSIFGADFLRHAIFAFSHWGFDPASERRRRLNNVTAESRASSLAEHFRTAFILDYNIGSIFYEKEYSLNNPNIPEEEKQEYDGQMEALTEFLAESAPCDMRGLVAILAEKDRIRKEAEEQRMRAEREETERRRQELLAAEQQRIAQEEQRRAAEAMAIATQARQAAERLRQQAKAATRLAAQARKDAEAAQQRELEARMNAIVSSEVEHQEVAVGPKQYREKDKVA